jgi:hypothetical protein
MLEVGSAIITVRPLTRLTLTEIVSSEGAETLNLNLQSGRIRVDLDPPAGTRATMSATSPVATASVRGTSFELDTRNIYVRHGSVAFTGSRGRPVQVSAGSSSFVEPGGTVANPVDTRTTVLVPPPPVGTGTTGGDIAETVIQTDTSFSIRIVYPQSP